MAQFVAEVRRIAKHCEFGPALDDMLRDRMICGLGYVTTKYRDAC